MKKIALISLLVLIFNIYVNSQIVNLNKSDSSILLLTEKVEGFGVRGNYSIGIAPKNRIDSIELAAYPKMKNLPDSLTDLVEYCFLLNKFQFFYQNYRSGLFTKDCFIKEAIRQKWNLNDTVLLTEKNIKNTISIAAGYNSKKEGMYIVDANNNNDFSDDTLRTLLFDLHNQDEIVSNSRYVDIESYDGVSVKKDKQFFLVKSFSRNNSDLSLSFCFPQFRYGKFEYNKKTYLVCAESYNYEQSMYVLIDRPYFSSIGKEKEIKPFQYLKLDNDYFQYQPCSQNMEKVKLKKVSISNDVYDKQIINNTNGSLSRKSIPVSNQVGMIAPQVRGVNILNDSIISLRNYVGKYVFLDFWATYCAPCIQEFPNIKEVYEKYSRSQFEIIGIVRNEIKFSSPHL